MFKPFCNERDNELQTQNHLPLVTNEGQLRATLGTWSTQVIPEGTYIRFGLVGPQSGAGWGSWLQIYAPQGVKFIP